MNPIHFESLYPAETRAMEIEQILHYVREGNSCQIVALPGVGRATVLGLLAHNKKVRMHHLGEQENDYHFVLASFAEMRRRPLVDVVKFLFLQLVDSLREREIMDAHEKTQAIFKESLSFQDELVLFQGLKQAIDFLALEKHLSIVFLFDRFEEYIPTVTQEFFANLRVLRNRAKFQFSAVFSLSRPLEESIEPLLYGDFHEFITDHTVYLAMTDEPGLSFRTAHIAQATQKSVDESLKEELFRLTAGQGKLTKIGIELLHDQHMEPSELAAYLLSHASIKGALHEMWHILTPAEQQRVAESAKRKAQSVDNNSYLELSGLTKGGEITIPLFADYLNDPKRPHQQHEHQQDSIVYDNNTNEIKKGDLVLSETLTASEFKLLAYLLEHPERTIDREEIIEAVWKDSASTAGVTDQALDQLIFRLRKKIEEDPNSPTHLQTVKGRGFKFTQ